LKKNQEAITAELIGGLGNQLFIYYAGRHLAELRECQLDVNLSMIGVHASRYPSDITDFELSGTFHRREGWQTRPGLYLTRIARRIGKLSKNRYTSSLRVRRIYESAEIGFDAYLEQLPAGTTIRGYFQTYMFVERFRENLVDELKIRTASRWFHETLIEMKLKRPIVVHVRGGDYVQNKDKIGMLSAEYYLNAITRARELFPHQEIWVFTDDLYHATHLLEQLTIPNVRIVKPHINSTPAESLVLISYGVANVISNSTFSWWGAYAGNPERVVYAPSKWFKNLEDPSKLIPPSWITIESRWL
jgi:hypothetical protein